MRVMAAAVLTMESLLMGFALLIAKESATTNQLILGGVLALLFLLTAGLLKRSGGYLLGSILQLCLIGYGLVVPQMYYMGGLFLILKSGLEIKNDVTHGLHENKEDKKISQLLF
jgi:hypothetical protein